MSFPLKELRDLLAPQRRTQPGVVVAIVLGQARVATHNGAIMARYSGKLSVGDRVLIENGFASLTITPSKVYNV